MQTTTKIQMLFCNVQMVVLGQLARLKIRPLITYKFINAVNSIHLNAEYRLIL